ncbi:unnamed protein product, partial [Allacma fusca]
MFSGYKTQNALRSQNSGSRGCEMLMAILQNFLHNFVHFLVTVDWDNRSSLTNVLYPDDREKFQAVEAFAIIDLLYCVISSIVVIIIGCCFA